MQTITLTDLRQRTAELVDRAAHGELFVVTANGFHVALLGPLPPGYERKRTPRKPRKPNVKGE